MLQKKQTTAATANPCSAMESGNHLKNGVCLKNLMSRRNLLTILSVLFFVGFMGACKDKDKVDEIPLSAPTKLTATQVDDESFELSWNPVSGAESYYVYIACDGSEVSGGGWVYDNFMIFKPKKEGTYAFKVMAHQSNSYDSDWSQEVSFVYTDPNVLRVPTGLTAVQVKDSIYVSWDSVKVADNYLIYAYNDKGWSHDYSYNTTSMIFYNLTHGAKYTFQVKACRGNESTDWCEPVSCVYSAPSGGSRTGLYMGIIGFNETLNEKNISLLTDYKNTYNTSIFTSFISGMTMKSATSLYYAVDNAITRLETATLPEDLVNVSIVTFTDGLDNVSIDLNTEYNSKDAYRDAVKKRIAGTKIKNLPINAYSIGVRGNDIEDVEAFRAGLSAMASSPDNAKEVTNMDEVNKTFSEIAASLYKENQSQTIKLKITGGYDDSTKIRFTLDKVTDAAESNFYIEGTYRRSGTARTLQDVVYHGVRSSSGTTITGDVSGVYVTFAFENFMVETATTMYLKDIQQWEYISSKAQWQRNSEFGQEGDIETVVDKKSAVIVLVLDCTSSLGTTGFSQMKNAATNFIKVLTNK